jgi:hypothetical protein
MKEEEVVELVNRHAEALNGGRDISRALLTTDAGRQEQLIGELFDAAGRVNSALTPVAPRPAFVTQLKQKLIREARSAIEQEETLRKQQWLLVAAGLGGLIYAVAVLAVGVRSAMWMFGIVALIFGWRKRQPATRTANS